MRSDHQKVLDKRFEIPQKIAVLKNIQSVKNYYQQALDEDKSWDIIPGLEEYTETIDETGNTAVHIGKETNIFIDSPHLDDGFRFGGLAMSIADFFRIPLIYLTAFLLKKKVPFNLNNNARWLYASVLLALTITSIVVPVIAPIIAFVSAGVGLFASVFLLSKLLYIRHHLKKECNALQREINRTEQRLLTIQDNAKILEELLGQAREEQAIIEISMQIVLLKEEHHVEEKKMMELYVHFVKKEKHLEPLNGDRLLFRGISLGVAALSIIGLVTALFAPPLGAAILIGAAVIGGIYLTVSLLRPLFHLVRSRVKNTEHAASQHQEHTPDNSPTIKKEHIQTDMLDESLNTAVGKEIFSEITDSTHDVLSYLGEIEHLSATDNLGPTSQPQSKPELAPIEKTQAVVADRVSVKKHADKAAPVEPDAHINKHQHDSSTLFAVPKPTVSEQVKTSTDDEPPKEDDDDESVIDDLR